jgi:hypothetical protein
MDIFISDISPAHEKKNPTPTLPKGVKRDRRKTPRDRRKAVNDGLIVTLSTKVERRSGADRRREGDR